MDPLRHNPHPEHPTRAYTERTQHTSARRPHTPLVVNPVDAANDDSSSSDKQVLVGSDPDSDDEDEGATPKLEENGVAEMGGLRAAVYDR